MHRGQRLVVDVDQVDGVTGDVAVGGDHHGDGVADVAHAVARQHVMLGDHQVRQQPAGGDHAGHSGFLGVGGGEDRDHAVGGESGGGVDALDVGVRVGAAHHGAVQHAVELEIVGVLAAPGDQGRVFAALDGGAEDAHGCCSWILERWGVLRFREWCGLLGPGLSSDCFVARTLRVLCSSQ